jgi:hypothetical protein
MNNMTFVTGKYNIPRPVDSHILSFSLAKKGGNQDSAQEYQAGEKIEKCII